MSDEANIDIPRQLPMMVLPCTLFPHCLMPLFIFEERYREMLNDVLESERFFCIGTSDPDDDPDDELREVATITTAGIVRACVTHDDGTSHLLLLGASRVKIVDWTQLIPYRIAVVEPIESTIADLDRANQLAADAIDMTAVLSGESGPMSLQVHEHLKTLDSPSAVADVIANNFVTDPYQRKSLLETLEVTERLHQLSQMLQSRIADQS